MGIPEVHIVADRYNGLFGKLTDTGELISLKSACRLRRGKGKNLQISALSTIEEWDAVLASSASKSRLLEILYETWEQMVISFRTHSTFFSQVGSRRDSKCLWSSVAAVQLYQNTVTTRNACPPATKRLTNAL